MDRELLDLTLGVKIPVTPGSKPVFSRGKLGEKLHRPSCSFDLGDPLGRRMSNEYNSLHDPYLKDYHQRKANRKWLERQGLVTRDGNVVCSLKEFNEYRQYRTMLKLEAKKAFIQEQEKLQEHLRKLGHAPKLPGAINTSCPGQRLLQSLKPSGLGQLLKPQKLSGPGQLLQPLKLSGPGQMLQPQKPSVPPPPKAGNNSMKGGRRLRVDAVLSKDQTHAQSELGHGGAAGALRAEEPREASLLRHQQQIVQVAKELITPMLESWGKHMASGSSEASEPGPVVKETTQVGKSEEEKSTATSDRAPSGASLEHLAREVIDCVCCTLEDFVTCQCERGDLCKYSGILELLRVELYKNSGSHPRSPDEGQAWMKAKDSPGLLKNRAWSPGKDQGRPPNKMEKRAAPLRMPSPARAHGFPDRGKPVGGESQRPRQQRGR